MFMSQVGQDTEAVRQTPVQPTTILRLGID